MAYGRQGVPCPVCGVPGHDCFAPVLPDRDPLFEEEACEMCGVPGHDCLAGEPLEEGE
ncbi:hypothetical protein [Wenjunlia tyrosinilytica]|uniref:Uncharacterized protein n=1 Tax=Wenjunlia tyrosinilytica TaxID=1544741 RepID=A0A918E223_9ACTN|nr:hypothetical protein [Wenjunlia tyrosinilytica]GGO98165.1 hypothetical protein GCM10012280_61660 [Wenjunlia tyrosinilytica]